MNPYRVLSNSIKAVPALKYALGVAGLAAVVALTFGFKLDPEAAVFGVLIVLGLMFVLVVFADYASQPGHERSSGPAEVLVWFFTVAVMICVTLFISSYFFSWPLNFHKTASAAPEHSREPGPTSQQNRDGPNQTMGISDSVTVEVKRSKTPIEFSFSTTGEKRQTVPLSVLPQTVRIEPKPTIVVDHDLPEDIPVGQGTITALRFGAGYMLFDTHDVAKGTSVRGEVLSYQDTKPGSVGNQKNGTTAIANPTSTQNNSSNKVASPATQSCPNGICIGGDNNGTATVINNGRLGRKISQRDVLIRFLSQRPATIEIACMGGDQESCDYARDWLEVLKAAGWNAGEVHYVYTDEHIVGVSMTMHGEQESANGFSLGPEDPGWYLAGAMKTEGLPLNGHQSVRQSLGSFYLLVGHQR